MYDQDVYDPYIHHRYTLNSYQVKDYWFSIKITGMSTPTFLQDLVRTLAKEYLDLSGVEGLSVFL